MGVSGLVSVNEESLHKQYKQPRADCQENSRPVRKAKESVEESPIHNLLLISASSLAHRDSSPLMPPPEKKREARSSRTS
jgi:hypothetical protein